MGTGDIGAASGEGLHGAVRLRAVKSGHNGLFALGKPCREHFIGLFRIEIAILVKENHRSRINKLIAQIICHDNSVQILSPGRRIIGTGLIFKVFFNRLEFLIQIQIQLQTLDDLLIAGLDFLKLPGKLLAAFRQSIAAVQHIRHLSVVRKTLSRSGGNHISSLLVRANDFSYLLKLLCARQRASSKFHYLRHNSYSSNLFLF